MLARKGICGEAHFLERPGRLAPRHPAIGLGLEAHQCARPCDEDDPEKERAEVADEQDDAQALCEPVRGAALLNQGRAGEAEEHFAAALASYGPHEGARQALVAIHLEQRRFDEAPRLLQEGLAINPGNARFATVLARILIERKDYPAALEVLDRTRTVAQVGTEFHLVRGTVLQRMDRHAEAGDAFRAALLGAPQSGAAWMALGISLEAQGKRPEAAEAFKRAATAANLSAEARDYAAQKARQLQ